MNNQTLYFSLEQSTLVPSRKVHIGDIATVFCRDCDIRNAAEKTLITVLPSTADQNQVVVSAMKIIELISKEHEGLDIVSIGCPETIVYYRNLKPTTHLAQTIKSIVLMAIAFFGTAFSIMSYHGDVGSIDLLDNLYTLFTGENGSANNIGLTFGIVAYSIGLCAGMILFFNHGINKKHLDDPTPLQVQMRLYEQDVNRCIILNSSRNNKTIDSD